MSCASTPSEESVTYHCLLLRVVSLATVLPPSVLLTVLPAIFLPASNLSRTLRLTISVGVTVLVAAVVALAATLATTARLTVRGLLVTLRVVAWPLLVLSW
jgi:hypothetical protein